MFYSPLRYPGGKGKLAPLIDELIDKTHHKGETYIEPFAGGSAISLELLETGEVSRIVLNDYDVCIYSFWKAILDETDRFIEMIEKVPLTMDEWNHQRDICLHHNGVPSFELGFATFYMNRTNRSGIIKGGVIGGKNQTGKYLMDVRFHKEHLIQRIERIAKKKDCIDLYNKDVRDFVDHDLDQYRNHSFIYFDPPYYEKGSSLYMNALHFADHQEIAHKILGLEGYDWIVTYDYVDIIANLYKGYPMKKFNLHYSAGKKRLGREMMIFKDASLIPDEDKLKTLKIKLL